MTAGRETKSWIAIVNPAAGGGRCARRWPPMRDALRAAGLRVETRPTDGPGHATTLACEALAAGARDLIAVGGDGTVNEVVNGMMASGETTASDGPAAADERPRLGLLPLGTGNSFLRDFTTAGTTYAHEALIADRRRTCDVLRLTHAAGHRDFINLLGFGFPADVGVLVDRRLKPLGAAGYTVGVLAELATLRPLHLPYRLDGGEPQQAGMTLLCVCNSRFTGGTMEMAPPAQVDDGRLDVVHIDRTSRFTLLRTFPKIFSGGHLVHPAVHHRRARRIDFDTETEVPINVDGEILRIVPRAVEVLPGAIDIAV